MPDSTSNRGLMDAVAFLRHVLDPDRLAVVGAVAIQPVTVEHIASATGQQRKAVLAALGPLVQAGIVRRDGDTYRLVAEALRDLARNLPQAPPVDPTVLFGMTADEQQVLSRFFRGDRLVEIPAARAKRLVVLERLALEFEPGVHYPEREVNDRLARFHEDYAALRRHLVDEGLLDRQESQYWRAGGRV